MPDNDPIETAINAFRGAEDNVLAREVARDERHITGLTEVVREQAKSVERLLIAVAELTVEMRHNAESQKVDIAWGQENRARIETLERKHIPRSDLDRICDRLLKLELWQARLVGVAIFLGAFQPVLLWLLTRYWK